MNAEKCRICGNWTEKAGKFYCKYCYENEPQKIKEIEFNIATLNNNSKDKMTELKIKKPKPKLYKFIFTYAENDNNLDELKEREITTNACDNALRLFHNTVKHHTNYMITNIAISKV